MQEFAPLGLEPAIALQGLFFSLRSFLAQRTFQSRQPLFERFDALEQTRDGVGQTLERRREFAAFGRRLVQGLEPSLELLLDLGAFGPVLLIELFEDPILFGLETLGLPVLRERRGGDGGGEYQGRNDSHFCSSKKIVDYSVP
jgi:hypothetical protein